MSTALSSSVFELNPYEGHPGLSELEAEVLWEYAKLSQNLKEVRDHPRLRSRSEVVRMPDVRTFACSSLLPLAADRTDASITRCAGEDAA